ncbi:MAG: glycosyltransferase [Actinomycetota bacterium]|nr:glycosyltransferase [Actinomycetota bacterium]
MRSRLRVFALVGLFVTGIDVGLVLLLARSWSLVWADTAALAAAALASYLLNRYLTFGANPSARWVSSPVTFACLAVSAGLLDVVVLLLLDRLGAALVVAKALAILSAATVRWVGYRWVLFATVRRELAERTPRVALASPLRLTVVIPAFNESENIGNMVEVLAGALGAQMPRSEFEILVADDGSVDDTAGRAEAAGARVLVLGRNRGKGAAVRAGVIDARGRSVVFTDADLAYSPEAVLRVLAEIEDGWDFVVGSRRHEETTTLVRARRVREIGSRAINWLTHLVLLSRFRDTQCGLKGFRQDIGRVVFERTVIDGFAFDIELFLIAEQDQLSVREISVSVANRAGSSVKVARDTVQLARDLLRIRRRAGAGGYRPTYHQELILEGSIADDRQS